MTDINTSFRNSYCLSRHYISRNIGKYHGMNFCMQNISSGLGICPRYSRMKSEKKLFRPLFNHGGAQIEFLGSPDWLQVATSPWERLDMQRRGSFIINFPCLLEKQPKKTMQKVTPNNNICKTSNRLPQKTLGSTYAQQRPAERRARPNAQ